MRNVAVVGAGICGCAAAYFARKYLSPCKVTIYDSQDRIGGRILTHKEYGLNLELGASFFSHANKTIVDIVNEERLGVYEVKERSEFAVWNGSSLIYRSDKKAAITNLKLLMKYKLSVIRTFLLLNEAKKRVAKLYQEEQKKLAQMDNLFDRVGIKEWCSKTLDEVLTEKGTSRTFIDEIACPITRTIYSQNTDIAGFAGISSLLGVYEAPIYRFSEGNSTFPTHLAETSHADVKLSWKIDRIEKLSKGYKVYDGEKAEVFDGVIIAAPLELAGIEFEGITKPNWEQQLFQPVFVKTMRGILNSAYFGLDSPADLPSIILTTKEADPLKHCSIQKTGNHESIVTFSSTEPLTDEIFTEVFTGIVNPVLQYSWKAAYPVFKPLSRLPPTRLEEGLVYANSIEASISSMETAALSALNAVKTINFDLLRK